MFRSTLGKTQKSWILTTLGVEKGADSVNLSFQFICKFIVLKSLAGIISSVCHCHKVSKDLWKVRFGYFQLFLMISSFISGSNKRARQFSVKNWFEFMKNICHEFPAFQFNLQITRINLQSNFRCLFNSFLKIQFNWRKQEIYARISHVAFILIHILNIYVQMH